MKPIEIKDISGNTRFSTPINKGAKGKFTLMKEDYIILPFSVAEPVYFKLGDYVDLSGVLDESLGGMLSKVYEIVEPVKPTFNISTGGYDYNLRLDAYYWKWKNKKFKYTPEHAGYEASWSLTAPLDVQLGVFLRNLKALGYTHKGTDFDISIDSTVENKAVAMTYDNMSLLDALFSMASKEHWDCDCWITDNIIHFGRNEYGDSIKLELGIEASAMTRSESKGTYATRIYAFGSTYNIPANYRPIDEQTVVNGVVQHRLMLPSDTPYIDVYPDMSEEEAIEDVVVFDEVYPHMVGTLSDVKTVDRALTGDNGEDAGTFKAYQYKDTELDFKEEYKLEGQELEIIFQSGKLNGLKFVAIFEPEGTQKGSQIWEIRANEDYGRLLPDETICPENGDKYILRGINIQRISEQYTPKAEQELKEKAQKYANQRKKDDGTYNTTLDSVWVYEDRLRRFYEFGQKVTLVNKAFFEDGRESRILGWEFNLDIPWDSPSYVIGESMPYSRINDIEEKVESLTYKGQTYTGSGGQGVYIIRTNDSTAPSDSNVFSAKRSLAEFLNKNRQDTAKEKITFLKGIDIGEYVRGVSGGSIDHEGNAEFLTAVIREMLCSTKFVDGMTGEGLGMWMDRLTGLGNLTIDKVTIRQSLVALELLIEKMRSVGGQLVVSAANGKIKEVVRQGYEYRITFEQANTFAAHDLMRCSYRDGGKTKSYWVEIASAGSDYVTVSIDEFSNITPKAGDDCVLMGNTTNRLRQNLILISATEDGQPRLDVLDKVKAKNFNGCLRARLGSLDGIKDSTFPADKQPKGYGIYSDNAWFKGTFILMTGEDILTKFEITEGKIHSAIEGLRQEINEGESYFENGSFTDGLNKWNSLAEATFFTFGDKWIWANKAPLSTKRGHVGVHTDGKTPYVRIRNNEIVQKLEDFKFVPEYRQTNSEGLRVPGVVHLSFRYTVVKAGKLKLGFVGFNTIGFEKFKMFSHEEDLPVSKTEKMFVMDGLWNGTGDFKLSFTGEIKISLLVFTTDKTDALTYKYQTLFEQSDKIVKIAASSFDKDGNVLQSSQIVTKADMNLIASGLFDENGYPVKGAGLITKSDMAGMFAIGEDGNLKSFVGVSPEGVKIKGTNISLEGTFTANDNFKILTDGSMEAKNGKFTGEINTLQGKIANFYIRSNELTTYDEYTQDEYLSLNGRRLFHKSDNTDITKRVSIGSDATLSPFSGVSTCLSIVSEAKTSTPYVRNIGVYINTRGLQKFSDAPMSGNIAMYIESGFIRGFRTDVSLVNESRTLEDMESFVIVGRSVTLRLPSNPQEGQVYYIKKVNAGDEVKIDGNGHKINNSSCRNEDVLTMTSTTCTMLVYSEYVQLEKKPFWSAFDGYGRT